MKLSICQLLIYLVSLALAQDLTKDQECFESISEAYGDLYFVGSSATDYYGAICQNPLKTCSMYASGKVYCSPHELDRGIPVVAHYCEEYGMVKMIPMDECVGNYSIEDDRIKTLAIVDESAIAKAENISEMTIISPSFYALTRKTVVSI
jgi:hypothetical protein